MYLSWSLIPEYRVFHLNMFDHKLSVTPSEDFDFRCNIKNESLDIHKYLLLIKNAKLVKNKVAKKSKNLEFYRKKWNMIT